SFYESGVIYMACARGGYVGSSRLEDGRHVIGTALDTTFVKSVGGLANAVRAILAEAGFGEIPDIEDIPWKGTPELTQSPSLISAHRAFVIGDAAGYVEPFTGEGMKWALASGIALAPIALKAIEYYNPEFEVEWSAVHHRIVS